MNKKEMGRMKERIVMKFKDYRKMVDDKHDLVLKRFAKEKYSG